MGAVLRQHHQCPDQYSGSIGKCGVWNYPYTLYNNAGASQIVNSGGTVTVDQNRSIGAVNFSGSRANGITFSGNGGDIGCRWDIKSYGSNVVTNNNGVFSSNSLGEPASSLDLGLFFSAPYTGSCRMAVPGSTQYTPAFYGTLPVTLNAGQGLSYAASTAYNTTNPSCNDTHLSFTVGTATVFYEN